MCNTTSCKNPAHFHPKGKPPSQYTVEAQQQQHQRQILPLSDLRDFEEAKHGLVTLDNGEKFVIEMSNATLTTIAGYTALDADLTITINRAELEDVMTGADKLVDKVKDGKAKMEGKIQVLEQLKATLVAFDPFFKILPGTKCAATPAAEPPKQEVFEDDAPFVKEP